MNRVFIKLSIIALGALPFIVGCGPQEMTDSDNLLEIAAAVQENQNDNAANDNIDDDGKAEDKAAPDAPMAAPAPAQGPEANTDAKPEGCAVGGQCPSGNCESPPDADSMRTVQLPDQTVVKPTKVTPTSERQVATDIVDYRTTKHIWEPNERHHTTHKHRIKTNRHFTKVVVHPTFRRINNIVRSAEERNEVMPVETEVAPPVDYGCTDPVPAPEPAPVVQPVIQPVIVRPVLVPTLGYYGRPYPFFGRHHPYRY